MFNALEDCLMAMWWSMTIYKQMLEKVFCSNIAPSLSSGNHLFYKAEYMGRSCPNQVWAITFDWSALATWNKHFWTAFWEPFSEIPHLPTFPVTLHKAPGTWKFRCQAPAPEWICMFVLRLTALEQEKLHCEQLEVFAPVFVSMWFFNGDRLVQE